MPEKPVSAPPMRRSLNLPSLRQLTYLVTLSETLNFTQAALACHVTQSTLSGGIQELERQLDSRLVERDRQQVRMTPAGTAVVSRARTLLSMGHDLVEEAALASDPMSGLIRLGAIPTVAPFLLPAMMRISRERHPSLRIALREDPTARLLDRIREGDLDFALIALPYPHEGLLSRRLFDEELWLITSEDDPVAAVARPRIGNLDTDRMLLLEEGHCLRSHTLAGCGLTEQANPGGIEATSMTTLVQMVEEGLGYALVPEMAIRSGLLNGSSLIARPIGSPAPRRTLALLARTSTARIEAFTALADIAMRTVREPGRPRRRRSE